MSKEQAESTARGLSWGNEVGFEALPYVPGATSEAGQEFMQQFAEAGARAATEAGSWYQALRAAGIGAAFLDDGWANREGNVLTIFPTNKQYQFIDRLEIGTLVALGHPGEYRLVRLTEPVPDLYRMPGDSTLKYRYVAAEVPATSQLAHH
jgi:hypothetical protein